MKKKLLIALVLTLCAMFTLTACLQLEKVTNLQLVDAPKTTYAVNEIETDNDLTFTISVDQGDSTVLFNYPADKDKVSLTGFSTKQEGTFTATITYGVAGGTVLTYTFEYTVTNGFAGGQGTEEDPYLISTADEFMMIPYVQSATDTYYKLTSDINFYGVDATEYQAAMSDVAFVGGIDGLKANGVGSYKIMGYRSSYDFEDGKVYGMGLFGYIGDAYFTNIDFVDCVVDTPLAEGAGLIGLGRSYVTEADGLAATDEVVFENIRLLSGCSVSAGENAGGLMGRGRNYAKVTANNVTNNATVTALTSYSAGGAFGCFGSGVTVEIDNFTNNGAISAIYYSAGCVGNVNSATLTIKNSINNGLITASQTSVNYGALLGGAKGTAINCTNNGDFIVNESNVNAPADKAIGVTFASEDISKSIKTVAVAIEGGKLNITAVAGAVRYEVSQIINANWYTAVGEKDGRTSLLFAAETLTDSLTTANAEITSIKAGYKAEYPATINGYAMAAEGEESDFANGAYVMPVSAKGVALPYKAAIVWQVAAYDEDGNVIATGRVQYDAP